MSDQIQIDKFGGEYKIVDGQMLSAVWVPVTMEEKEAMVKKAEAEGINLRLLVANVLKEWVAAKETLSVDDLEKVAGGASFQNFNILSIAKSPASAFDPRTAGQFSTVMCPW